jgi:BirA family biotin operon repressor/biotin-[acetyl-CoA-carboxylase] ligase
MIDLPRTQAPSQPLRWGAEGLWQQLLPLLPGLSIEVLASVDSTNTRLLERARRFSGQPDAPVTTPGELDAPGGPGALGTAGERSTPHGRRDGDTQPCLLVAETQTQGRGRLGRTWHARAGCSLTFSLALPLHPASWSGLSLAVGVAVADALEPPAADSAARIGLKWPNDLWLMDAPGRGRKLGGILIETLAVGERRMAVVGIGLNVLPQPAAADFASGFACLQELHPGIDAPQALQRVALPLARALKAFEREGFAPFAAGYRRRDLLLGQPVLTTQPGVPEGVAEGVDEQGALRVRAGEVHTLVSGEVSVRPAVP